MLEIEMISEANAEVLCRKITIDLPEFFGILEANEHYALGVGSRKNFAAKIDGDYIGLISMDFPYPNNANIYWMAILRKHQNMGIGQKLIETACKNAIESGAKTITVETLAPMESDENYSLYRSHFLLILAQGLKFEPDHSLEGADYYWHRHSEMLHDLHRLQVILHVA